jgi:hypothetical protein
LAPLPEAALPAPAETPSEATASIPADAGGNLGDAQPTAQPAPATEASAVAFDAGKPAAESSPETVPVAREPEPPKP